MRTQIVLLTLGIAVTGSNSLVLSPILADVAVGLNSSPVAVSRAIAAYGGATALSAFLLGPRIDRVGPRRALMAGMAALAVATLLSAAAGHWSTLALAQALAGLGAGIVLPSIYALAAALAPQGREAALLGRVLTGWSLAMVLGVPASALIADALGWRASFMVLGTLALAALLGSTRLPEHRTGSVEGPRSVLAPLTWPGVPPLLLVCVVFMAAFYGTYAFVGDALRTGAGVTAGVAGLAVLAYGLGFGLASLADRWLDRLGPERLLPRLLLALGAVHLLLLPATGAVWSAAAVTLLWGFVNHLGLNALILLLSRIRPDRRGAVLGLNSAVTYLGALIGTGAAGPLYDTGGFAAVTLAAAALVTSAGVLALVRPGIGLAPGSMGRHGSAA